MKYLLISFAFLLGIFMGYLLFSCGNPVDYSKLNLIDERTELTGDVELPVGTITILVTFTGKGEFTISKWYPDNFSETITLYRTDKQRNQSLKISSTGGVYSYEVRNCNLISIKFYE